VQLLLRNGRNQWLHNPLPSPAGKHQAFSADLYIYIFAAQSAHYSHIVSADDRALAAEFGRVLRPFASWGANVGNVA